MKVAGINTHNSFPGFRGSMTTVHKKIANTFAKMDGIGEGASIAFDFLGKAVVVPAVIMLASEEPKEKKEYSAIKNPVAATIQLLMEVPILYFGSKAIEKGANKGYFDNGKNRQYNEKYFKDKFVSSLKASSKGSKKRKEAGKIIDIVNEKGLTRKTTEAIEDFIKTVPKDARKAVQKSFNNYQGAHKRLFHLQNRLCFLAAIIMTPLLCALENKLHPIVMDKIYEEEAKHKPKIPLKDKKPLYIHNFIKSTGGAKVK